MRTILSALPSLLLDLNNRKNFRIPSGLWPTRAYAACSPSHAPQSWRDVWFPRLSRTLNRDVVTWDTRCQGQPMSIPRRPQFLPKSNRHSTKIPIPFLQLNSPPRAYLNQARPPSGHAAKTAMRNPSRVSDQIRPEEALGPALLLKEVTPGSTVNTPYPLPPVCGIEGREPIFRNRAVKR